MAPVDFRLRRSRRYGMFLCLLVLVAAVASLPPDGPLRWVARGVHRAVPGHSVAITTGAPALTLPVPARATSGFGWRVGDGGRREFHAGADLPADEGQVVLAAADGVVERVAEEPAGYGRFLVIDHRNGWETLYAHLSGVLVAEGDPVRRGQPVARAGRTGNATRPHLHLELRFRGEAVDPLPYFEHRPR